MTRCAHSSCGRPVGNPGYTIHDRPEVYCSPQCRDKHFIPAKKGRRRKMEAQETCTNCGQPLPFLKYTNRAVEGKFCSNACLEQKLKGEGMTETATAPAIDDDIADSDPDTAPKPRNKTNKAPAKKAITKKPAATATPKAKAAPAQKSKGGFREGSTMAKVYALMKDGQRHTMESVNKAKGDTKTNVLWSLDKWGQKNRKFRIVRDPDKGTAQLLPYKK